MEGVDDLPEDLFDDESSTFELEDAAELAQIAYQASEAATSQEMNQPDGYPLETPPPVDMEFLQSSEPVAEE